MHLPLIAHQMHVDPAGAKSQILQLFKTHRTFPAVAAQLECSERSLHRYTRTLNIHDDIPKSLGQAEPDPQITRTIERTARALASYVRLHPGTRSQHARNAFPDLTDHEWKSAIHQAVDDGTITTKGVKFGMTLHPVRHRVPK